MPLRIETGHYSNLPGNPRVCLLCEGNHGTHEYHFLFQCELYSIERSQVEHALSVSFTQLAKVEKLNLVFEHPFILGKFVRQAIRKHHEKLYR